MLAEPPLLLQQAAQPAPSCGRSSQPQPPQRRVQVQAAHPPPLNHQSVHLPVLPRWWWRWWSWRSGWSSGHRTGRAPPVSCRLVCLSLSPTGGQHFGELSDRLGQLNATGRGPIRAVMHAMSLRRPAVALLGFVATATGLRGYVYLQPLLHTDMPGDTPSGADQTTLVQVGDVRFFGHLPMVEVVALGDDVMTRRSVEAPTVAHFGTLPNVDIDAGIPPDL